MAFECGQGTLLAMNSTLISQIRSISGPDVSVTSVDVTTLDSSSIISKKPGNIDPGQITLDLIYDHNAGVHGDLVTALTARTTGTFLITFPSSNKISVGGFVAGLSPETPLDDAVTASVTIECSGPVTYST